MQDTSSLPCLFIYTRMYLTFIFFFCFFFWTPCRVRVPYSTLSLVRTSRWPQRGPGLRSLRHFATTATRGRKRSTLTLTPFVRWNPHPAPSSPPLARNCHEKGNCSNRKAYFAILGTTRHSYSCCCIVWTDCWHELSCTDGLPWTFNRCISKSKFVRCWSDFLQDLEDKHY